MTNLQQIEKKKLQLSNEQKKIENKEFNFRVNDTTYLCYSEYCSEWLEVLTDPTSLLT